MIHFSLMAICNGLLQKESKILKDAAACSVRLFRSSFNYKDGNGETVYIMPVKPNNTSNFTPINKNIQGKTGSKCFFHNVSLYLPIRNLSHSRQPKHMAVTKYPQPNAFRWFINVRSQQLGVKKLPPPKKLHCFHIVSSYQNMHSHPLYSNLFHYVT